MCGICGIAVAGRGAVADVEAVKAMNGRLVHRGPDSDGLFHESGIAMAMRRLSIIDLEHGDQPIFNEDGSVTVVHNGEIYNYRELRAELERRGHRFATHSDTEVLVHLYEEHGAGFVERLRGMFAIALWDARERRLLLARDRFGIKPLYYRDDDGTLSFASELKAMLEQPGFSREIDSRAVAAYLAFNSIPAPLTIFAEARKLPAGTLAVWHEGELSQTRYARPAPVPAVRRGAVRRASWPRAARDPARLGPRPPRRRCPGRRAALGRGRFGRARGARRRRAARAGEDLLGRLRGGELR